MPIRGGLPSLEIMKEDASWCPRKTPRRYNNVINDVEKKAK
jgi:hypothetical protein